MYSKQKICTPILWFKTSPGYVDVSVSLLLICCFIQKWSIWFGQQQSFWKGYCICHRQYSSDAFLESRQKVSMRKVPPLTVSSVHYNNIQFILNAEWLITIHHRDRTDSRQTHRGWSWDGFKSRDLLRALFWCTWENEDVLTGRGSLSNNSK